MPLYRNGQRYELTKQDKEEIKKLVRNKFPVIFKMNPDDIRPDPSNKGRFKRPPGVNINTKVVIPDEDEGQYVQWQWGPSFKQGKKPGEIISSVPLYSFELMTSIGTNQMDLLYFLLFCCKNRKGSKLADPNTKPTFVLEDVEGEAEAMLEKEAKIAAATHFIVNEWSEAKIRKIGAAMNFNHAENENLIGISELKQKILYDIKKSPKRMELFDLLTKSEEEVKIRASITRLVDENSIYYDDAWYLMNNDEGRPVKVKKICDVIPNRSALESLIVHWKKNPSDLQSILIEEPVKPKQTPKKTS